MHAVDPDKWKSSNPLSKYSKVPSQYCDVKKDILPLVPAWILTY